MGDEGADDELELVAAATFPITAEPASAALVRIAARLGMNGAISYPAWPPLWITVVHRW